MNSPLRPYLDRCNERLPTGIRVGHGTLYVGSTRLEHFVERLAQHDRPFKALNSASSKIVGAVGAATLAMFALAGFILIQVAQQEGQSAVQNAATNPKYALLIPGVNEFFHFQYSHRW